MERYVTQLVEQLEEAKSRKPEMRKMYLPKDMNDLDEMIDSEMSMQKEYILEDIFGIPQQYFPPVEKLTDEQMEQLVIAILDLWREFHYAVDMPENIQIRHIYQELVSKWQESLPLIRTSNETIHIVLSEPDSSECTWSKPDHDGDIDDFSYMFHGMSFEAKRELFEKMNQDELYNDMTVEIRDKLIALTDNLYQEIIDEDELSRVIKSWEVEFSIPVSQKQFIGEFLGIDGDCLISDEDVEQLNNLCSFMELDIRREHNELAAVRKRWGNIPFVANLELKYLLKTHKFIFKRKLKKYLCLYPHYSLIKLTQYEYMLMKDYPNNIDHVGMVDFTSIFENRISIASGEMFDFQIKKMFYLIGKYDLVGLEAMSIIIEKLNLLDGDYIFLYSFVNFSRIRILLQYFNKVEPSRKRS